MDKSEYKTERAGHEKSEEAKPRKRQNHNMVSELSWSVEPVQEEDDGSPKETKKKKRIGTATKRKKKKKAETKSENKRRKEEVVTRERIINLYNHIHKHTNKRASSAFKEIVKSSEK